MKHFVRAVFCTSRVTRQSDKINTSKSTALQNLTPDDPTNRLSKISPGALKL
jgi:hypothetical protein